MYLLNKSDAPAGEEHSSFDDHFRPQESHSTSQEATSFSLDHDFASRAESRRALSTSSATDFSLHGDCRSAFEAVPGDWRLQEEKKDCREEAREGSSLLRGFLFMNNYCLFNNMAAICFKLLMQQGVSVLVLALCRNLVLLGFSSLYAYFTRSGPFQPAGRSLLGKGPSRIPLRLRDPQFILA